MAQSPGERRQENMRKQERERGRGLNDGGQATVGATMKEAALGGKLGHFL